LSQEWKDRLVAEAAAVGVSLEGAGVDRLVEFVRLLEKWNRVINLTRIESAEDIRIKHLVDSLAALPVAQVETEALDLGAGGGLPGIPWMCARADLRVTLVDSDAKKVGFLKAALPALKLSGRAIHARISGDPTNENLERSRCVVSRAFRPPEDLFPLALPYVAPGGSLVGMWGPIERAAVERAAGGRFEVVQWKTFDLPGGKGQRTVARLVPRETPPAR
jgi:16S rRNA (guanine527-N7)-methyltransferase